MFAGLLVANCRTICLFSCSDTIVKDLYAASLKIDTEENIRKLSEQLYNLLTQISIDIL